MRARLMQLVGGIREMAKYGPMKQPDKAGIDTVILFIFYGVFFFLHQL